MVTCSAGHNSLLLDSRDYWADLLQFGRPKKVRCKCGGMLFGINLSYEFREAGDVRSVEIVTTCFACGQCRSRAVFEIKYGPTDQLVSRPLDPIDHPWLQPKRHEITAYWKPTDAERFARYLVSELGGRVFQRLPMSDISPCTIHDVEFYPELKPRLYFTNFSNLDPPSVRDPENAGPFLNISGPFHIVISFPDDDVGLLHYVKYSKEVVRGGLIVKQPEEFLAFARDAVDWLGREFPPTRGKFSADNPEEYARIFGVARG